MTVRRPGGGLYETPEISRSAGSSGSTHNVRTGTGFVRHPDWAELRVLQSASRVPIRVLSLLSLRLLALRLLGPKLFRGRSVHRRWALEQLFTSGILRTTGRFISTA